MPLSAGAATGTWMTRNATLDFSDVHSFPAGGTPTGSTAPNSPRSPRSPSEAMRRQPTPDAAAGPQHQEQPSAADGREQECTPARRGSARSSSKESGGSTQSDCLTGLFNQPRRVVVARILGSTAFDALIGLVILANSITVGVEQTLRIERQSTEALDNAEHFFLCVYILELAMRFYAERLSCLSSGWVRFDCLLVVLGVLTGWILTPFLGEVSQFGPLMVLRTARLLRLARTVRLLIKFRELWMLVRGLLNSASTMFYTFVLLTITLYIFACISIEMITLAHQDSLHTLPEDFQEVVENNFRSVPVAMLTLVQFVCFDNVVYIYKPLIEANIFLAIFFVTVILTVGVVLMNLVTAVIVNSALEEAMQDKDLMKAVEDAKRKKLLRDAKRIFLRLDEDGSGEVSREEVSNMCEEDRAVLGKLLTLQDPVEMFDMLDVDQSGDIGIEEFCAGIQQVAISNTPIEIKRMERQIDSMHKQLKDAQMRQEYIQSSVMNILTELRGVIPADSKACNDSPGAPPGAPAGCGEALLALGMGDGAPSEWPGAAKWGQRPTPPWFGQLVAELRRACSADIHWAMDEVSRLLAAQARPNHGLRRAEARGASHSPPPSPPSPPPQPQPAAQRPKPERKRLFRRSPTWGASQASSSQPVTSVRTRSGPPAQSGSGTDPEPKREPSHGSSVWRLGTMPRSSRPVLLRPAAVPEEPPAAAGAQEDARHGPAVEALAPALWPSGASHGHVPAFPPSKPQSLG